MIVDKLQVEIDIHDSRSAVFALIHLANLLAESSTMSIKDNDEWEKHEADEYSVKWRFTELCPTADSDSDYDLAVLAAPKRKISIRQRKYYSGAK